MSTTFIELKDCLESFLRAWQKADATAALEYCQLTWRANTSDPLSQMKGLLEDVKIKEFEIGEIKVVSPVFAQCQVKINKDKQAPLNLLKEIAPYKTGEKGTWGVNPISALKLI